MDTDKNSTEVFTSALPNSTDPRWRRMPSTGAKVAQFSRSSIIRAVDAGLVRTRLVRLPGSRRGMRFISESDLSSLIEKAPASF